MARPTPGMEVSSPAVMISDNKEGVTSGIIASVCHKEQGNTKRAIKGLHPIDTIKRKNEQHKAGEGKQKLKKVLRNGVRKNFVKLRVKVGYRD